MPERFSPRDTCNAPGPAPVRRRETGAPAATGAPWFHQRLLLVGGQESLGPPYRTRPGTHTAQPPVSRAYTRLIFSRLSLPPEAPLRPPAGTPFCRCRLGRGPSVCRRRPCAPSPRGAFRRSRVFSHLGDTVASPGPGRAPAQWLILRIHGLPPLAGGCRLLGEEVAGSLSIPRRVRGAGREEISATNHHPREHPSLGGPPE